MMEYVVWTSGRRCKSFRNSEYFPDQPLMYERFRKEKIVEAKVAKSAGNGNAMGNDGYYCDQRQPKRTACGFGLQRSFGRNILQ